MSINKQKRHWKGVRQSENIGLLKKHTVFETWRRLKKTHNRPITKKIASDLLLDRVKCLCDLLWNYQVTEGPLPHRDVFISKFAILIPNLEFQYLM